LDDDRREIQTELKELYKEKNTLMEKMSRAKLDVQREQNEPGKAILQEMVYFYKEQMADLDESYQKKTEELEQVKEKKQIIENKILTIEEKMPR
jgi:predicted  nucleic acid-binding Zn-ribbon protein